MRAGVQGVLADVADPAAVEAMVGALGESTANSTRW